MSSRVDTSRAVYGKALATLPSDTRAFDEVQEATTAAWPSSETCERRGDGLEFEKETTQHLLSRRRHRRATREDAGTPFSHLREPHVHDAPNWLVFSVADHNNEGAVLLQVPY